MTENRGEDVQQNVVNRALSAIRWVAALRFAGQAITWLSTIFVIRFLAPEDYGIVSLAEVLRTFLVLFSTLGLSQGLISEKNLTPALVRKTLGLLVLVNSMLFLVQFFSAPFIAAFYNSDSLELVLKVSAVNYLLVPWTSVPSSLIAKELNHEKSSKVFFASNVLGSILSLVLAYLGFGYWALISATMFMMFFNCVWLNILQAYPRIPLFSFSGAGSLFRFGAMIAVSDLLWVAYSKADVAIGGRYFDIAELGLYTVAAHLATMLMSKIMPLFNFVGFPAFAKLNETHAREANEYLVTVLRVVGMLMFPLCFGVAYIGEDLIRLVLGESWGPIYTMFAIFSITVPLRILAYIVSPAVLATGAAKVNLINTVLILVFTVAVIFLMLPWGTLGVAVAWSLSSLFIFVLIFVSGARVLGISLTSLSGCLYPALPIAMIMVGVLWSVDLQGLDNRVLMLFLQIILGAGVYIGIYWFFYRKRSRELLSVISRLMGTR